jgi:dihydroorotase
MYIDSHVHCRDFEESYKETIEHALSVAEDSNLLAIFDMPNTKPLVITRDKVIERLNIAKKLNSKVFYGLYVGLTSEPNQIKEAVDCFKEFFPKDKENVGVVGLKMFAGKSVGDLSVIDPVEQLKVYKTLAELEFPGVLVVHSEKESVIYPEIWNANKPISHGYSRPEISEISSIKDQINFAIESNFKGHLHIAHVSVPESVDLINEAKNKINISCGATPHHLLLDDSMMQTENGILFKVNPPLRCKKSKEKLFFYFKSGFIDFLESDHAPHSKEDKFVNHMSGIPNLASWPDFIHILKNMGISEDLINKTAYENINKIFKLNIKRLNLPRIKEYVFDPYSHLI